MLENVEELLLLCFCVRGLGPAYIAYIYEYVALFLCMQVCS